MCIISKGVIMKLCSKCKKRSIRCGQKWGYCNECDAAYKRQWYLKNREKIIQRQKQRYYSIQGRYISLKCNAKERGKEFSILFEEFKQIFSAIVCCYCGIHKDQLKNWIPNRSASLTIDRLDNSKGYISGNLAMCCYRCNRIKSDFFTASEMKEIAEKYIKPRLESL